MKKILKLNLGCRNRPFPTYINIDIDPKNQYADVIDNAFELKKIKDDSISLLESQHMFEHLSVIESEKALKVWYKKLKKGGIVRISVPDISKCSALLLLTGDKNLVKSLFYDFQLDEWDFHRNLHTKDSLSKDLVNAGFSNVKEWDWRTTWPHNYIDSYASCYFPHFRKNFIMDNGKAIDLGGINLSLNLEATK